MRCLVNDETYYSYHHLPSHPIPTNKHLSLFSLQNKLFLGSCIFKSFTESIKLFKNNNTSSKTIKPDAIIILWLIKLTATFNDPLFSLMDSDFWTARLAAAKRQFAMQHQTSHLDRLNADDFEVEEEIRPDFPCPYCYEDFDIGSLCSHLEDEHSCESRTTICPVCSIKVTRDMLSHISLQHGHLFKLQRRRRLRRVGIPNSSLLGRDLHLQVLLGGSGYRLSSSDPFLSSSLVLNFPGSETEEINKSSLHQTSIKTPPQHIWKSSFDPSLSSEEREKRMGRAVFLQDLLVSTLFAD